jgi:hypothetical protein
MEEQPKKLHGRKGLKAHYFVHPDGAVERKEFHLHKAPPGWKLRPTPVMWMRTFIHPTTRHKIRCPLGSEPYGYVIAYPSWRTKRKEKAVKVESEIDVYLKNILE